MSGRAVRAAALAAALLAAPAGALEAPRGAAPAHPAVGVASARAVDSPELLTGIAEAAEGGKGRWPEPIHDDAWYRYALFDLLEYGRVGGVDALRWDVVGWIGGDVNRLWLRSEGNLYPARVTGGEADLQLLYGRLVTPFFDLQAGARVEQHYERGRNPVRVFAGLGMQGLAPGWFEIEPQLFLSNKGYLSGRFTASVDLYQTQRLVLQPRFETELALQRDEEFGVEPGIADAEIGVRVRYEIRREVAPYLGLSYRQSLGATRDRLVREGGNPNQLQLVGGVRIWM